MLEHPEIAWIEKTGYPSWMQGEDEVLDEEDEEGDDYDSEFWGDEYEDDLYEEARDRERFGD